MDDEVDVSCGAPDDATACAGHVTIDHTDGRVLRLRLSGRWTLDAPPPVAADVFEHARAASGTRVVVDGDRGLQWDSGLLIFLRDVLAEAERRRMSVDFLGLPEGARRLLALASATPQHKEMHAGGAAPSMLGRIGSSALVATRSAADVLAFIGEACVGVFRLGLRGARCRPEPPARRAERRDRECDPERRALTCQCRGELPA